MKNALLKPNPRGCGRLLKQQGRSSDLPPGCERLPEKMSVASLFAPRYKGGLQQRVCPGFSPGSLLIAIRRTVAWAKLSVFILTAPCFYINVLNLTYRQVKSELTDMTAQYIGTRHKNHCRNMDQDTGTERRKAAGLKVC